MESGVINAIRDDQAEAELVTLQRERRTLDLCAARLLSRMADGHHYAYRGCSSIAQLGEMHGLSGREARLLTAVGRVLGFRPELEEKILAGRLSLDAVAVLGQVFERPELVRDGEDWVLLAEGLTARQLEKTVRKRIAEAASGEPTSELSALLTSSGREKFERARVLASRKRKEPLSEGQTVEVLSDHYLDCFDPERKKPRRRRMADTSGRSGRSVAAAVDREVTGRSGGGCPVPGCDNVLFMDKAHIVPHRNGGSREADNLLYLCRQHHVLFDSGLLAVDGTTTAPVFKTADGKVLGSPARAPPP